MCVAFYTFHSTFFALKVKKMIQIVKKEEVKDENQNIRNKIAETLAPWQAYMRMKSQ